MGTIMLELCRQERLLQLMEDRGFTLCQQNGQRTYGGPPPNWGVRPPPPRESEIFIGRLPRTCFEDELIPLFASIGELYEFRLMLDFSGANRGFAYAHYATEENALNAIKILNHYEIRPGHFIGVLRSKNNCRLLFSNIKRDTDPRCFTECIRALTSEVQNVCVFASFEELKVAEIGLTLEVEETFQEKMSRYSPQSKFAIVEYESHRAAALARRVLIPKLGHMFAIDWAIPLKDKNPFDQSYENLCEIRTTPGNDFVKARPVPLFNPRRSSLDRILYITAAFRNVAKYFKFLLNITLHKSMRKGDIPLSVYLDMEKRIIDRVKNVEHCGQATQLILNYLTWYSEKRMMMIDSEAEKILTEVKFYSERMLHLARNRLTSPNEIKTELEAYISNTLLVHLNFCYFMAIFLSGDERENVCGLITDSLNWFEGIMQKVRLGNEQVTQFLLEVAELAGELEDDKRKGDTFYSIQNSRKRKPEHVPLPNFASSMPFSGKGFPRLKKCASASAGLTPQDYKQTAEYDTTPRKPVGYPIEVSVYENENYTSQSDNNLVVEQLQSPNLIGGSSGMASPISELNSHKVGSSGDLTHRPSPVIPVIEGGHQYQTLEKFPVIEKDSAKEREIPVLVPQPSMTEFVTYMPKQFYNVVKYYKYLIITNIQKSLERCEITLLMYREIMINVINNISNLESCIQGTIFLMNYLASKRDPRLISSDDELFKILQDVRFHAVLLVNYIYSRGTAGPPSNSEAEEYYCHLLPNQMSFLYHLSLLLNGEEKAMISGRLADSISWVNDLVQKNNAGDVEVVGFFERLSRTGVQNSDGSPMPVREIMKDIFDEFNNLLGQFKKISNN